MENEAKIERIKTLMENLWAQHKAPWKVWED